MDCDLAFKVTPATSIANNTTDFFSAITLAHGGARFITFQVSLDTAVKLYARINGVNQVLNSDTALIANGAHAFTLVLCAGDTLTFRASAACAVNHMVGVITRG